MYPASCRSRLDPGEALLQLTLPHCARPVYTHHPRVQRLQDALDRSEYQAAIATALASAKVATRDPGDRMEVWEEAIKKAVEKKETVNEPYP